MNNGTILLGVTGSISAYKAPSIANSLKREGYDVKIILTEAAKKFIGPLAFSGQGYDVYDDSSEESYTGVLHVDLAKADYLLIAPASANTIAKISHGFCDNLLTSCAKVIEPGRIILSPAMNTQMYLNPTTKDSLDYLKRQGVEVIEPASKRLACGVQGVGALPDSSIICNVINEKIFGD